jgi:hypothetical protein
LEEVIVLTEILASPEIPARYLGLRTVAEAVQWQLTHGVECNAGPGFRWRIKDGVVSFADCTLAQRQPSHTTLAPSNTEISCEGRATECCADLVSFISLLDRTQRHESR